MEKHLGIYISNDVNWNHHLNYSINKANKQLGRIKHAFEYIDEYIIGLLYKSLIRPNLEYGAVIWNPHCKMKLIDCKRSKTGQQKYSV